MGGLLNDALLSLSISLGHQTGLFDTMAELPPATSDEIAKAADLDERYVREVLGALTTGGIVTYDARARTYALPPSTPRPDPRRRRRQPGRAHPVRRPCSARSSRTSCAASARAAACPTRSSRRSTGCMAELTKETVDATLLDGTLDLVDGPRERLETGIDVADIGCGAGYAMNVLGRRSRTAASPASTSRGGDRRRRRRRPRSWGLDNVTLRGARRRRTSALDGRLRPHHRLRRHPRPGRPGAVLQGIADALRPDGVFLCVDIAASSHLEDNLDHPLGPVIYTISTFHCMTVSLALDGAGLGAVWGEQTAARHARRRRLRRVDDPPRRGRPFNIYYVARKA